MEQSLLNSGTSDGGTVEHLTEEQRLWNRDNGTVDHLMVEQLNNHGGTLEHLMVEQWNV